MRTGPKAGRNQYVRTLPSQREFFLIPRGPWQAGRTSFKFMLGEYDPSGKRKYKQYVCPAVFDLERKFKKGQMSAEQAHAEMLRIRDEEYARVKEKRTKDLNENNVSLVERYLESVTAKKVDIQHGSRIGEANTAWRVVRMMGKLDLSRATANEIQRVLNQKETFGSFAACFTQTRAMLRFINRHEVAAQLKKKRFADVKPPFLTREQVYQVIDNIPASTLDQYPLMPELIRIIFNLGLRVGEALALEWTDLMKKNGAVVVHICRQYAQKRPGEPEEARLRGTKNKRNRHAVPLNRDELLADLRKWVKAYPSVTDREPYRFAISKTIHDICERLFKKQMSDVEDDELAFDLDSLPDADDVREYKGVHMLRASHAVYLMEAVGNESFTANQIGDTPEVVRKHYTGRHNTDRTLATMANLLETHRSGR